MTNSIYCVYEHWRPDKDVCFYVGKGKGKRPWQMINRNGYHKSVVSKLTALGLAVDIRIIAKELPESTALSLEIALISFYGRKNLTNLTDGGEGASGAKRSIESRKRRSESMMGNTRGTGTALTPETKEKLRIAHTGKILYKEHRAKLAEAQQRRWMNPDARKRMSEAKKGQKLSEDAKEKLRNTVKILMENEEYRKERSRVLSETVKQAWADPERRARIMAGRRKGR